MAALTNRFVICGEYMSFGDRILSQKMSLLTVVLINLAVSFAPDGWRYFNSVMVSII